jgi:molybdopterin molybdotransferase
MSNASRPTGCDDPKANFLSVDQALARIREGLTPVQGFEQLAIRSALGRILAEDVRSPINVPPYSNSAMDGYAVRSADLPAEGEIALTRVGTSFAGEPFDGEVGAGQTVRIMTGAMMPAGADTVIMQEHTTADGERVRIGSGHEAGQNVRHPGEDIAEGQVILAKGKTLNPAELGLLASLGIPEVRVQRRLRVAFFSTGDELRSLGEPLEEGQIYDSNRYTIFGMLTRLGAEIIDMGVVRDRREDIAEAFEQAAEVADVVITSGGVSVGDADFVKEMLDKLGRVNFWKIAMKPGKPLAFGQLKNAVFFGLPGNPVSVMATFYQIVQPALRVLTGAAQTQSLRLKVPCATTLKKSPGRQDFQRGILETNEAGELVVRTTGNQGSHVLSSMSQANCFIILPAESGSLEAGEIVEVEPFAGLV